MQNGCNDWRLVSWRWEINVFFFKDVFASSVPIEFISDISYFQTSKLNVPAYFFFRERRNQRLLPETSIISRVCLALTASEVIKLDWYWTSDGNQRAWILFWFSILRRRSLILPKKNKQRKKSLSDWITSKKHCCFLMLFEENTATYLFQPVHKPNEV